MILTCPHCGFSKDVPSERIPAGGQRLVCPRCKKAFALPGQTPQGNLPTMQPPMVAGFLARAVAEIIDLAVIFLTLLLALAVLGMTAYNRLGGIDPGSFEGFGFLTTLFCLAFWSAYWTFFTGYCGQTPGKILLRLKVVRTSGAEIGYGGAMLRELVGKFLSSLLFGAGFLMVPFNQHKQGLHDHIADTYVIKI